MKNLMTTALVLVCILCAGNSMAQEGAAQPQQGLEGGTLQSQFDYIYTKSESYEAYKVIKKSSLNKLKTNTLDSVKALKQEITDLENNVQEQQKEVNALKTELQETNAKLEQVTTEKDSFSFLGMMMSKGSYNMLVWSLVFIILITLLIMIVLFKRSNSITIKTKELLEEKQEEFDAHRKWALEREQTLARDLNKLKQKYKGLD
ncbi:hypothetical protein E9993_22190 [Labilibacter sediminis]|nr:hypothetical protein E9993_22190 [Labilibacter sediminis]